MSQLGVRELVTTGIWWVEAKDSTKYPAIHRTAPHNQESSSPNVKTEVENSCLRMKDKFVYFALRKRYNLGDPFGFWRQHIYHIWVYFFDPFTEKPVFPGNGRLCHSSLMIQKIKSVCGK